MGPDPRQTAERNFETAGPVDARRIRILRLPMPPLAQGLIRKTPVAREPVGFPQRDQMLMAVEFPRNLAVAHFGEIQISNFVKRLPRSLLSVYRVKVPVDRPAIIEVFITEKVEAVLTNSVRPLDDILNLMR